jgi:hypothetical protein
MRRMVRFDETTDGNNRRTELVHGVLRLSAMNSCYIEDIDVLLNDQDFYNADGWEAADLEDLTVAIMEAWDWVETPWTSEDDRRRPFSRDQKCAEHPISRAKELRENKTFRCSFARMHTKNHARPQ